MEYQMDKAARHEQLREALIGATSRAIEAHGLSGLKARALADEVSCAVGAIYNVVADLDELILLVNARTLASLELTLTDASSQGRGKSWAVEQLVTLSLAYLKFASSNRRLWGAVFEHRLPPERRLPDWYQREQAHLFSFVEAPIAVLQPKASPARRAQLTRSLFSAVHGMVALGLEEKLQLIPLPVLREQVTTIVTALGNGLARTA
jgi:AcrR family transcriptional regulator